MAVDEARRSALFQAVARAVGKDHAVTMFELIPPPGTELATRADVDLLRADVDLLRAEVGRLDQRFESLEQRFDLNLNALRHELLAAFRSELTAAITAQTRVMVITTIMAVVGIGGLAVTLSQVL